MRSSSPEPKHTLAAALRKASSTSHPIMPVPTPSHSRSKRDSWPPTQVRLQPADLRSATAPEDEDLSSLDEDPLTYFLTPALALDDEDMDGDVVMDFDAGIEDAKHPPPIVRSVSPSNLDGLRRLSARPPTPPRTPPARLSPDHVAAVSSVDEDDEHEEYFRFGPGDQKHQFSLPFALMDLATRKSKTSPNTAPRNSPPSDALSFPALPHISPGPARGRSVRRPGPRPIGSVPGSVHTTRDRHLSAPRSPPHAWREPSPDVWSIEEEPEEERNNKIGDGANGAERDDASNQSTTSPIDIPAAKPKKKVRFLLP